MLELLSRRAALKAEPAATPASAQHLTGWKQVSVKKARLSSFPQFESPAHPTGCPVPPSSLAQQHGRSLAKHKAASRELLTPGACLAPWDKPGHAPVKGRHSARQPRSCPLPGSNAGKPVRRLSLQQALAMPFPEQVRGWHRQCFASWNRDLVFPGHNLAGGLASFTLHGQAIAKCIPGENSGGSGVLLKAVI